MPLGEIRPRVVTPREAYWIERWMKLEGRELEDLGPVFRHMSRAEFFAWLYSRNPRQALILVGEPGFREIVAYQRDKRWYHEVRDYFWRARNGR